MVDEDYYYDRVGGLYEACTLWRNRALEGIAHMKPDVVVVGGSAFRPFNETQWVEGSRRVFARLASAASQVIVVAGTPQLGFHGPSCIGREMADGNLAYAQKCRSKRPHDTADTALDYLKRAAAPLPNVRVVDLSEIVCPGRVCSAVSPDGLAVFRDGQHISDGFVRARIGAIRQTMLPVNIQP